MPYAFDKLAGGFICKMPDFCHFTQNSNGEKQEKCFLSGPLVFQPSTFLFFIR
jgi:hypothetical protein